MAEGRRQQFVERVSEARKTLSARLTPDERRAMTLAARTAHKQKALEK
jgi:hypothetical protein